MSAGNSEASRRILERLGAAFLPKELEICSGFNGFDRKILIHHAIASASGRRLIGSKMYSAAEQQPQTSIQSQSLAERETTSPGSDGLAHTEP